MRTSRVSRDTSRVFNRLAATSTSPPRRTTRSSLAARFAYSATATPTPTSTSNGVAIKTEDDNLSTPDIEDAFSAPPAKKRRRTSNSPPIVKSEPGTQDSHDLGAIPSPPRARQLRSRRRLNACASDAVSPKLEPESDTIETKPLLSIKQEDAESHYRDGADSIDRIKSESSQDLANATAAPRRSRKPARKVKNPSTGEVTTASPSDWEQMYDLVRQMRAPGGAAHGAAVDTMGCERLADRAASPKDQRFHTLISLMLSSQTKDTVNAVVMRKLQTELPAFRPGAPVGLNLENVLAVEPALLNNMIWAVGFHNNKTKYIKRAAEMLRDEWAGDIPDTIEGLTSLPGVGPKMAYLCMSVAWDRTEGIGVDVHVHRITNLWGWNKTKNPEETRHALQSWLPRDRWREINHLLVGLGQKVCLPVGRRCGECELGLRGLCKAADRKKVLEGRRAREVKEEEEAVVKKDDDNEKEEEEGKKALVRMMVKSEVDVKPKEEEMATLQLRTIKEETTDRLEEVVMIKKEEDYY